MEGSGSQYEGRTTNSLARGHQIQRPDEHWFWPTTVIVAKTPIQFDADCSHTSCAMDSNHNLGSLAYI